MTDLGSTNVDEDVRVYESKGLTLSLQNLWSISRAHLTWSQFKLLGKVTRDELEFSKIHDRIRTERSYGMLPASFHPMFR